MTLPQPTGRHGGNAAIDEEVVQMTFSTGQVMPRPRETPRGSC